MNIIQQFIKGIGWYPPKTDSGSWDYFAENLYSVNFNDISGPKLIEIAQKNAELPYSLDSGKWGDRKHRLENFIAANTGVNTDDPLLYVAIQFEFIACFRTYPGSASHNNDLWTSISNSADNVLSTAPTVIGQLNLNVSDIPSLPSTQAWLNEVVPKSIYIAIANIRRYSYFPAKDTDSWAVFQSKGFDIGKLDHTSFMIACATFISHTSSGADSGIWDVFSQQARTFLEAIEPLVLDSEADQLKLAIQFCDIFSLPYHHAAHNNDLWGLYSTSFEQAAKVFKSLYLSLVEPTENVAYDSEIWSESSTFTEFSFEWKEPFWPNFYDAVTVLDFPNWHAQHIVRLKNKDGCAYFMISQSRPHNGYITVVRTKPDALDPETDLLKDSMQGTIGDFVWQEVYTGEFNGVINPHGNWCHPGKMAVVGDVLIVAAQNWSPIHHFNKNGTSSDAAVFYDVSDPEQPKFMGLITKEQLCLSEVSVVGLAKVPEASQYLFTAGGDGKSVTYLSSSVTAELSNWSPVLGGFSGQHGLTFNSFQHLTLIPGPIPAGVERMIYFDAGAGDYDYFSFSELMYSTEPTPAVNPIGSARKFKFPLPGARRDWDTSSIYIAKNGRPVIYTVKSGEWDPYKIIQVHN